MRFFFLFLVAWKTDVICKLKDAYTIPTGRKFGVNAPGILLIECTVLFNALYIGMGGHLVVAISRV